MKEQNEDVQQEEADLLSPRCASLRGRARQNDAATSRDK